jgi:flagellar basal body-associated protein FliL
MPKAIILLILTIVCGGGGFALAEISQMSDKIRQQGTNVDEEAVIFDAGQFTIPLFDGGRVPYFLLTEINIEVEAYDQVSFFSNNRPHLRATVLETLFELERRGEIKPGKLNPENIKEAIKADLEATFGIDQIENILIDRLLIQETGRR